MHHPHVVLLEVAVLKCMWLYVTCVEQKRTCFSYRLMRYSLYFWILGSAFLVSGSKKLKADGNHGELDTLGLSGPCLSSRAPHCQVWLLGFNGLWLGCTVSGRAEREVQVPGHAVPEQVILVPNAYLCIHCTTHLEGWKLYVNSTAAKPCACPQCLCACLWEGVSMCGCHCFPEFFYVETV